MDNSEFLKNVPLFSRMDAQEIAAVTKILSKHEFVPGQVIIRQGEPGDHFYVIVSGEVQFLTNDAGENEIVLDEEGPGGFFGELSMLTGEPRVMRVRAKSQVSTLALNRNQFHEFLLSHPHAAIDVLTVLGKRLYQTDKMLRQSMIKNVNVLHDEKLTLGQRVADKIAETMGSWRFIIVQSVFLMFWILLNVTAWIENWDPYPFILLNLMLSFQAAYAAPIIMMSQNRQADKDRVAAEVDHEVNVKAEVQVRTLMQRLDDIERGMHELHRKLIGNLDSRGQ